VSWGLLSTMVEPNTGARPRRRRPTPPLSRAWLLAEARRHIERWLATEERLRRLLWKRVGRAQSFHGGCREDAAPLVEEVIAALRASGGIDDRGLALRWIAHLRQRGASRRRIAAKLRAKGVSALLIEEGFALCEEGPEAVKAERQAAEDYARRRRLGVHRRPPQHDRARLQKDLASMARAGFSYDLARAALEGRAEREAR